MVVIIMGVSGSGKSTVGSLLSQRLGWEFRDGDEFHPPANVDKMKAGTPLNDQDRWPWLKAIHDYLAKINQAGRSCVVACSALKQEYRQQLAGSIHPIRFVHLHGTPDLLALRLAGRPGHFMPPSLLASQLATLEYPTDAISLDIALSPTELVDLIIRQIGTHGEV